MAHSLVSMQSSISSSNKSSQSDFYKTPIVSIDWVAMASWISFRAMSDYVEFEDKLKNLWVHLNKHTEISWSGQRTKVAVAIKANTHSSQWWVLECLNSKQIGKAISVVIVPIVFDTLSGFNAFSPHGIETSWGTSVDLKDWCCWNQH